MIQYDRAKSVAYAKEWAFDRNPRYFDFTGMGGDCTNFVSQCLVAGGMPMNYANPMGWFFINANSRSASFSGVTFLHKFLINGGARKGPVGVEMEIQNLLVGDIIQLSFDGENWEHSLLVVENNGVDPKISTHSYDAFGRSLSTYTYKCARGIHILGAN